MSTKDSKVIAVIGASGAQGGGLVRAIQADPDMTFRARAIVRDEHAPGAEALSRAGVEVVAANLDDASSLERAFEGAHGAFCVTFFWHHFSPEKEIEHARSLALAARKANVAHAIWSTLEDTRKWVPLEDDRMPTLMGRYKVPHFDAKGEANAIFVELGLPTTFLNTSFYWENFIHFGMGPKRGVDGKLTLSLPLGDAKLPGIAAEDIGRAAWAIFRDRERWTGKTIGIAGEHLTGSEMAASLSRVLREDVRYDAVTPEAYRASGFRGADDLGNMFQFKRDFEAVYRAARDLEQSRALVPSLLGFDRWLAANGTRIPID